MHFHCGVQLYQYAALPFGLASVPRQFTKIMKPNVALKKGRRQTSIIFVRYYYLMQLSLPDDKVISTLAQYRTLVQSPAVIVHRLARIIGTISSTMQAILPAPLDYRHLQLLKTRALLSNNNFLTRVTLTEDCLTELCWWIGHLRQWIRRALLSPDPDMIVQIDASKKGWGAYRRGPLEPMRFNGLWSAAESELQINLLELMAAEFAV